MDSMQNVLALILGGGRGTRLYPLTKLRAKPALPLAGKYRLIDIPVSNCINSGILKIYVLTQFNSASLNQHIANTYRFPPFMKGFVDVLAAQQTEVNPNWFEGTADAVRKSLWVMQPYKVDHYLILSGDHLYRMNYQKLIAHHRATSADITIAVVPVDGARASSFGLMKLASDGRIIEFKEKPTGDALASMQVDTRAFGLDEANAKVSPYLASTGIYVFNRQTLIELLAKDGQHADFGKHVIPMAINNHNVQSYVFNGYWEDIGEVETFYQANLALIKQPKPDFSFYDAEFPIYTRARFLPPSKVVSSHVREAMICDGCIVKRAEITNSIVGIRSRLEDNTVLENTLLMGADYYQSDSERTADLGVGTPPVGIGAGSVVQNAIIDKNARIGRNVQIVNREKLDTASREVDGYWIRSGIVIVIKDSVIPDGTII
jgi:glucose-1-phosphate adenylyltransferase